MKSLQLDQSSQPPGLMEVDTPAPKPGAGEVLVRVDAAGLMPTELIWYPTLYTREGQKRTGIVPAHEFAGEIAALGSGVTGFSIGEQIYGMNDWFDNGAMAEYCLSRPAWIAPKPQTLSPAEAAAVPISALTAWQALFDRAKLRAGETVLIHGGAGSVGTFAIQFAHWCGAHVTTTVSAYNAEFVRELGADKTVDYKTGPFETTVKGVDVVLDTIGGETLRKSWALLKPGGRLVTVATSSESTSDERVKQAFLLVEPRSEDLLRITELINGGNLRPIIDAVIPMSQAANGYRGKLPRSGRGKVVVTIP